MKDVVALADGLHPRIGFPTGKNQENAAEFMVSRLFTDAVFNQDIRAIQLIINRIDGGLPKDTDMKDYKTEFADCLDMVMNMTDGYQLRVFPEDSVMLALCKSLYALSVQDIYWDEAKGRKCRPSTDKKQERDSALRMILERIGGRKTLASIEREQEEIETADWINSLPESCEVMV